MRIHLFLVIAFSYSLASSAEQEEYFGEYQGDVVTQWLDEGRKMKLLSDFTFIDPNQMVWTAPKEREIDGASIPKFVWSIIGSPFSGKYRNASVIHDIACEDKTRTWESVHLAFYYAMRASGVSKLKAKTMYAAVHHMGPRWPITKRVIAREEQVVRTKVPIVSIKGTKFRWETIRIPAVYEDKVVEPAESNLDQEEVLSLINILENSNEDLTIEFIQNYTVEE